MTSKLDIILISYFCRRYEIDERPSTYYMSSWNELKDKVILQV